MTIYAATTNTGKLAEFATCASGAGVEVLALPGLAEMPEPVEDAVTFMGNAELKARAYSLLAPGRLVMADDSGLEVDALGGQPGVRSARFAEDLGFEATEEPGSENPDPGQPMPRLSKDERNNRCVLALLRELPGVVRSGRFVCALVVAKDGVVVLRAEGFCDGLILDEARGVDGFGYDPLFLVPTLGMTLAEVPRETKWEVSHRGRAFRGLLELVGEQKL